MDGAQVPDYLSPTERAVIDGLARKWEGREEEGLNAVAELFGWRRPSAGELFLWPRAIPVGEWKKEHLERVLAWAPGVDRDCPPDPEWFKAYWMKPTPGHEGGWYTDENTDLDSGANRLEPTHVMPLPPAPECSNA